MWRLLPRSLCLAGQRNSVHCHCPDCHAGRTSDRVPGHNHAFQSASYGFTVFSILGPLIAASIIVLQFCGIFVWNWVKAFHRRGYVTLSCTSYKFDGYNTNNVGSQGMRRNPGYTAGEEHQRCTAHQKLVESRCCFDMAAVVPATDVCQRQLVTLPPHLRGDGPAGRASLWRAIINTTTAVALLTVSRSRIYN